MLIFDLSDSRKRAKGCRGVTTSSQTPQKNGNEKILANFGKFVLLKQFCFLGNFTGSVQALLCSVYPDVFIGGFLYIMYVVFVVKTILK